VSAWKGFIGDNPTFRLLITFERYSLTLRHAGFYGRFTLYAYALGQRHPVSPVAIGVLSVR